MEYTIEIRLKDVDNMDGALMKRLKEVTHIENVSMIAFRSDLAAV